MSASKSTIARCLWPGWVGKRWGHFEIGKSDFISSSFDSHPFFRWFRASPGGLRICKLYLNSAVARDGVLSWARNLRGKSQIVLAGVRFRPSLTQSQLKRKQLLEDYRWNTFTKDSTGRLPVVVHYQPDGPRICGISLGGFVSICCLLLGLALLRWNRFQSMPRK